MGYPTLLYERMRRTKGTRVFIVRDLFALGTVIVTSLIGFGIHHTNAAKELHSAIANGDFDNSAEYEQKKMYFQMLMIPTSSKKLKELEERENQFMDAIIRVKELL